LLKEERYLQQRKGKKRVGKGKRRVKDKDQSQTVVWEGENMGVESTENKNIRI